MTRMRNSKLRGVKSSEIIFSKAVRNCQKPYYQLVDRMAGKSISKKISALD